MKNCTKCGQEIKGLDVDKFMLVKRDNGAISLKYGVWNILEFKMDGSLRRVTMISTDEGFSVDKKGRVRLCR